MVQVNGLARVSDKQLPEPKTDIFLQQISISTIIEMDTHGVIKLSRYKRENDMYCCIFQRNHISIPKRLAVCMHVKVKCKD